LHIQILGICGHGIFICLIFGSGSQRISVFLICDSGGQRIFTKKCAKIQKIKSYTLRGGQRIFIKFFFLIFGNSSQGIFVFFIFGNGRQHIFLFVIFGSGGQRKKKTKKTPYLPSFFMNVATHRIAKIQKKII